MSDSLQHECGIALVRLLKPLEFYKEKFSNLTIALSKGEFAKFGSRDWRMLTDKIDAECWI